MGKIPRTRNENHENETKNGCEQKPILSKTHEEKQMKEIFQTIAGNVGKTYAELLDDQEFRQAVEKVMKSDEYKKDHDNQSLVIAKNNKENDNE